MKSDFFREFREIAVSGIFWKMGGLAGDRGGCDGLRAFDFWVLLTFTLAEIIGGFRSCSISYVPVLSAGALTLSV